MSATRAEYTRRYNKMAEYVGDNMYYYDEGHYDISEYRNVALSDVDIKCFHVLNNLIGGLVMTPSGNAEYKYVAGVDGVAALIAKDENRVEADEMGMYWFPAAVKYMGGNPVHDIRRDDDSEIITAKALDYIFNSVRLRYTNELAIILLKCATHIMADRAITFKDAKNFCNFHIM